MFNSYTINTLRYEPKLCTGCERCIDVCPHAVFAADEGKAQLVRPEACMECGACQLNCQAGAIRVDSGVGCATAMMWAALRGRKAADCS
jgi:NAD-dependent dihydropyrimidine dehydrogenase PreA subunit